MGTEKVAFLLSLLAYYCRLPNDCTPKHPKKVHYCYAML